MVVKANRNVCRNVPCFVKRDEMMARNSDIGLIQGESPPSHMAPTAIPCSPYARRSLHLTIGNSCSWYDFPGPAVDILCGGMFGKENKRRRLMLEREG